MELQEILDTTFYKLVEQGEPARLPSGECTYYDPDTGNRCAIGFLVDQEVARGWVEDGAEDFNDLLSEDYVGVPSWFYDFQKSKLLTEIQHVHDHFSSSKEKEEGKTFGQYLEESYGRLAKWLKLIPPKLKES
jgi:hypothetical protein